MFIRTKRIKGAPYAYLVKNVWTPKGPRQRVARYLGRVVAPARVRDLPFHDYVPGGFERMPPYTVIRSLIAWELENHGFIHRSGVFTLGEHAVDLNRHKVTGVIHMNGDYLCSYTIRRLMRWKNIFEEGEAGRELARAFVMAGIPVPPDVFVELFEMISRPGQSYVQ